MKNRRYTACLMAVVILLSLLLASCQKQKNTQEVVSEQTTVGTAPPLLNIDIASLLTSQQVSEALGVTVGEANILEQGTVAQYMSEDAQSTAEIRMMECERAIYDSTVEMYEDAVDAPNLGEVAKWSEKAKQLLVYEKDYMISITADAAEKTSDDMLVAARQIAALLLEKL